MDPNAISLAAQNEVEKMTPEQLKAEFAAIIEARKANAAKQKEKLANDPEAKAKRLEYAKKYREANPEKFAETRKAYMQKPEVKAKMKEYQKNRLARQRAILLKAKELGIDA